jgi:hypothetical protein
MVHSYCTFDKCRSVAEGFIKDGPLSGANIGSNPIGAIYAPSCSRMVGFFLHST